jgi:hypothetical protein
MDDLIDHFEQTVAGQPASRWLAASTCVGRHSDIAILDPPCPPRTDHLVVKMRDPERSASCLTAAISLTVDGILSVEVTRSATAPTASRCARPC